MGPVARAYGGFRAARRIDLRTLHEHPDDIVFLQAIWRDRSSLDPRDKSNRVTREIATKLAEAIRRATRNQVVQHLEGADRSRRCSS